MNCSEFDETLLSEDSFQHRLKQLLGISSLRMLKDFLGCPLLNHFPILHNEDVMTQCLDYFEIMADEEVGEKVLPLKFSQYFQDLKLDGTIQGGSGLIEKDKSWFEHQGPCDGDSLTLPT